MTQYEDKNRTQIVRLALDVYDKTVGNDEWGEEPIFYNICKT